MDGGTFIVGLLQSPAFQAIFKQIVDSFFKQVTAGINPVPAGQQAAAQGAAAVAFHLTGHPVADLKALLAQMHPVEGGPTGAPT